MAWKCDKCGMPNFDDGACKLCGAPKPENPEEFIEEIELPSEEVASSECADFAEEPEVIPEPEPAEIEEPEIIPEPEPDESNEPEVMPEPEPDESNEPEVMPEPEPDESNEPEVMPDPEIIYTEDPSEPEEEEELAVVVPPVTPIEEETVSEEGGKKKTALIVVICAIILALLCAAGWYLFGQNGTVTGGSKVSASPSPKTSAPSIAPTKTPDPSLLPSTEPVLEEPAISAPSDATVTSAAPTVAPTQKINVKTTAKATPKPAAKVTPKATATPAPVSTPKPTPKPTPVPTPVPTPEPWNDNYKKFVSEEYRFYCAYPADFTVLEENTNDALLTAVSPDKTAHMMIQATKNWDKLSTEEALNRYIAMFDGEVQYQDNGNTWYAASVKVGDRVYYRKAFVRGDSIYCFSFEYDYKDKDLYSPYMEYIEDHFKRN